MSHDTQPVPSAPSVEDQPEIAILGMAGRFPGASSLAEYWHNLAHGVESILPVSDDVLAAAHQHDPRWVKRAAPLADMECFDAGFFGYTPREAELMDPQHRVFLELCHQALEHAGLIADPRQNAIGVFAGASTNTYLLFNLVSNPGRLADLDDVQIDVANGADFLCTRIAYKLNLHGPAFTVASACSTSLVAVHLACQSLLNQECDVALAGGISIHVKHPEGYRYVPGGIVSADGHCRAFDHKADGTVFGSGGGVVVLKRLADARRDGDPIHAVIKGSAINNDGAHKVGYTAPSALGQAAVIREALAAAGVTPDSIGYIEAHGTGTALGDPIEIRALRKAFRVRPGDPRRWSLGSVKSNIGHLSGAAGVAALIKTVLALKHQRIPPTLHFTRLNPEIDADPAACPFELSSTARDWPRAAAPRRAGISSFGVGGTNAHVILEEAPPPGPSGASRPVQLLLLSAKSEAPRAAAAAQLAAHLQAHPDLALADVAHTLRTGRQTMSHRRAVVCRDRDQAIALLAGTADRAAQTADIHDAQVTVADRPVVFLFPGQGTQHLGMARGLYQSEPVFREHLDRAADLLQPLLGLDLRTLLYPGFDTPPDPSILHQTRITQPALFAVEYALAQLWLSLGVKPTLMLGHSIGEYVAACLAGVWSFEDALALVAERGRLIQTLPSGAMLAVFLSAAALKPLLPSELSLAAINGPALCVASGPSAAIDALADRLTAQGTDHRRLRTSHAFHSGMMDPLLAGFADRVRKVKRNPPDPAWPWISNVNGHVIAPVLATDPNYWATHLREPVRFAAGLETLFETASQPVLIEVGPGHTLGRLARAYAPAGTPILPSLAVPHDPSREQRAARGEARPAVLGEGEREGSPLNDDQVFTTVLAKLWLAGVSLDWRGYTIHEKRRRVPLPTYPFERRRYWIDAGQPRLTQASAAPDTAAAPVTSVPAESAPAPVHHPRPPQVTPYVAPRTELETRITAVWQQVLGIEPIGADDNFFELGGHSLLATQLRNQLHELLQVDLPIRDLLGQPTVAGVAALVQASRREQAARAAEDSRPIAEQLRTAFPTDRPALLHEYLRRRVAAGLQLPIAELPEDGSLAQYDLTLLGAELEYALQKDFKFQLFPHEVRQHPSIPALTRYLLAEMDRLADPRRFLTQRPLSDFPLQPYRRRSPSTGAGAGAAASGAAAKNPSMVFVHSSPRAGSTLFRVMLAGHPQLFCPPEVNLLFFDTLAEWRQNIGFGHEMEWTTGGLQWAFMELMGLDSAAGRALVDRLTAEQASAKEVYGRLQALCQPRLLVDKTPSYSLDRATLERAEAMFDQPKYIYLYRHPYPVMESILRVRFDRLFGPSLFGNAEVDPYVVAETVWALSNRNLLEFFATLDPARCLPLRYEDLVTDPTAAMTTVCRFLGIPFDERVLAPYDGKRERMMGGLGDPNLLRHTRIEAALGDSWKKIDWPRPLDPTTLQLMTRLGYPLPAPAPAVPADPQQAAALLDNLDQLSDDQVAALLAQMSPEN